MHKLWRPGESLCVGGQNHVDYFTEYQGLDGVDALVFGKVLSTGDRAETDVGTKHCEQHTVTDATALPVTDCTNTTNDQKLRGR